MSPVRRHLYIKRDFESEPLLTAMSIYCDTKIGNDFFEVFPIYQELGRIRRGIQQSIVIKTRQRLPDGFLEDHP